MEALLCAVFLLATLVTIAIKTLTPVTASGSAPSTQPNFSSKAKTRAHGTTSFEIETPDAGSIGTPWDSGSLWDDEAPAYDLTQQDR